MHLAEVIRMALHEGPSGPKHGLPEAWTGRDGIGLQEATAAVVLTAGAVGAGLIAWDLIRRATR